MKGMAWNIGLGLLWMALTGVLSAANLLLGLVLGYLVLLMLQGPLAIGGHLYRMRRAVGLLLFFTWELILANLRVAWDIVTPRHRMRPGVFAVPLDASTDAEITILANLVSLTPGTLSLDVSDDRRVLYVHAMYPRDRDTAIRSIKDGFERRLLDVLR